MEPAVILVWKLWTVYPPWYDDECQTIKKTKI